MTIPPDGVPHVTVVVPTLLARGEVVTGCVRSLLAQTYPAFDVLVVDNRPVDREEGREIVPVDPRLAILHEPHPGTSAARNLGLAHATGAIVAFTDDDVVVDPEWLTSIVARFVTQPELDAVTGLIEAAELETDAQRWFEEFYGGFAAPRVLEPRTYRLERPGEGPGRGRRAVVVESAGPGTEREGEVLRRFSLFGAGTVGAGANTAFRTAWLRALGGYDTRLGPGTPALGGEDLALLLRALWAGGVIGYEPTAMVSHRHRAGTAALRRQLFGYGIGFTAMITSLVAGDVRLLAQLLAQVPHAVRVRAHEVAELLRTRPAASQAPAPPSYPRSLVGVETVGWLLGPVAFARSALSAAGPALRSAPRRRRC